MAGLESAALKAGNAVVTQVVRAWLTRRRAENRRGAELTELIELRFGGLSARGQRDLRRKLEEAGDRAGEHLQRLSEQEFHDVDDAERTAAVDAAVDALTDADLSDETLLRVDLYPVALAQEVRRQVPAAPRRAGLGESARGLFDLVLDQICVQLIHLVRELPEYEDRLGEESLRRLSTALSGIEEVLERLPATSLDAPAGVDRDEQFRRRYLEAVARKHDDLELIGVSIRNFRPRTKLSVAYLSLTVDTAFQVREPAFDPDGVVAERGGGSQRIESALSRTGRVLVRGQAGSGKSTLLSWLIVTAATERFGHALAEWNGCVPVLIKLRSFANSALPRPADFLDTTALPPEPEGWMQRQLASGRVLLLVDGVDEVPDKQRKKVRAWLDELLGGYPDIRVVVTARPAAAGTKWLADEGFSAVMLEDMLPNDVREFLSRWHEALLAAGRGNLPFDQKDVDKHHRRLLAQLESRPHLRNLTRNPLMCAMLCALNLDRDGDLPRNRKGLYEAALEMLLDRRDAVREIGSEVALSYADKLVLLQGIAHWLALNGRSELTWDEALGRVERVLTRSTRVSSTAEAALGHLLERSGVLREPAPGRIDFVHRTFQEFLTARESVDDGNVDMLVRKAGSDQWRETVIMAAGLFHRSERGQLLSKILERANSSDSRAARRLRLLAATCRESVHDLEPEVVQKLDECINALIPPANTTVSRSLSTVGDSVLDRLPTDITGLSAPQAAACVYTAALVNGPDSLPLLRKYAEDPRLEVQDELIDAWSFYDPEEYARTVLRDAPLHDGAVLVDDLALVPWLKELRHHRRTHVDIDSVGDVDLAVLNSVAGLRSLRVYGGGEVNLTGLGHHHELVRAILARPEAVRGVEALRELKGLHDLVLTPKTGVHDLSSLASFAQLSMLNIGPLDGEADSAPLESLTELRHLVTWGPGASGCVISALPRPEKVVVLNVIDETDLDLSLITERCTGLRFLRLDGNPVLNTGDWARLPALRELVLESPADQETLGALVEIPSLRELILANTDTVDLAALRNAHLDVLVENGVTVLGAGNLPPGTRVRARKRLRNFAERNRKAARHAYRY